MLSMDDNIVLEGLISQCRQWVSLLYIFVPAVSTDEDIPSVRVETEAATLLNPSVRFDQRSSRPQRLRCTRRQMPQRQSTPSALNTASTGSA